MGITGMIKKIGGRRAAVKNGEGRVEIGYPQKDEEIVSPSYTFRVGAGGDVERVEISVNKGPWQPCRYSAGYWWYDWTGYAAGRYQVGARARLKNGAETAAGPVKFRVSLGSSGKNSN